MITESIVAADESRSDARQRKLESTPSGVAIVIGPRTPRHEPRPFSTDEQAAVARARAARADCARSRPERLGAERASAASARSTARRPPTWRSRGGGSRAIRSSRRLEDLVGARAQLVYDAPTAPALGRPASSRRGYWRLVAERPVRSLVAGRAALRPGAGRRRLGACATPARRPARARPSTGRSPSRGRRAPTSGSSAGGAGGVLERRSSRTTSASRSSPSPAGSLLGLGTAFVLVFNGVAARRRRGAGDRRGQRRAVRRAGRRRTACSSSPASSWPAPPGCGSAGRSSSPGRRTRRDALARGGAQRHRLVLGTAPWLVLAGLVEGFVTPLGHRARRRALVVGFALGGALLAARPLGAARSEPRPRLRPAGRR